MSNENTFLFEEDIWKWTLFVEVKNDFFIFFFETKSLETIKLWRMKVKELRWVVNKRSLMRIFKESDWFFYFEFLKAFRWDFKEEYAPKSVLDWEFNRLISLLRKTWIFKWSLLYQDLEFYEYLKFTVYLSRKANVTINDKILF